MSQSCGMFGPPDSPELQGLSFYEDGSVMGGRFAQLSVTCPKLSVLDISYTGIDCTMTMCWLQTSATQGRRSGSADTGGWKASLTDLNVAGCKGINGITRLGHLYNCKRLRILNIEDAGLKMDGLKEMLGYDVAEESKHPKQNCGNGFPPGLAELRCGGNRWNSNDIATLVCMKRHQNLKIHTDGHAGAIMNAVRNVSTELSFEENQLSPTDCTLLTTMMQQQDCRRLENVHLYGNAITNEGLVGSGLLKALTALPNLRELDLQRTSLDDKFSAYVDGVHQPSIADILSQAFQAFPRCFPKLCRRLKLGHNNFSNFTQNILRKAWVSSGRPEKFRGVDVLDFR